MRHKLLIGFALLMLTSLILAPSAWADRVEGTGTLTAHGDGFAVVRGAGTIDVTGSGILWVYDRLGGAVIQVTGQGEKEVFPDGWIQYSGFNGTAHIEGGWVIVGIAGANINLTAKGTGGALLWGHGSYELNGVHGRWSTNLSSKLKIEAPTD
jgi:hypothetical protein